MSVLSDCVLHSHWEFRVRGGGGGFECRLFSLVAVNIVSLFIASFLHEREGGTLDLDALESQ